MPGSRAASASLLNVHYAALASYSVSTTPPGSVTNLPGGSSETEAMIFEVLALLSLAWHRSATLSESICSFGSEAVERLLTVCGWQPRLSAILVARNPSQLGETMRALAIQSPGT